MKRVNIHLEDKVLEQLKEIGEEYKKVHKHSHWHKLTRADLVRYAIGKTFNIKNWNHWGFNSDDLEKSIKIITKRTKKDEHSLS